MIQKLKKSNAGFTLVELLVVIAILGVLSAILVPQYLHYVDQSRQGADRATLGEVLHAIEVAGAQTGLTGTVTVDWDDANDVITIANGSAGEDVVDAVEAIVPAATLQSVTAQTLIAAGQTVTISNTGAAWTTAGTEAAIAALG